MKPSLRLIVLLWAMSACVWGDATTEIQHLIDFIGGSGCTFVRNGEESNATAAKSHIAQKYDYARRWIRTADELIEHVATRSSITGEPYRVVCAGHEELSAVWLRRELNRFRTGGGD